MKWALMLFALLLVPVIAAALRAAPWGMRLAAFGLGLLPFVYGAWRLYFDPVAWPLWAGATKGIELTALDVLALAVLVAGKRRPGLGALWPWLLYLGAVVVTVPLSEQPIAAIFYVWQLVKMVVLFMAAMQLADVPGGGDNLLRGAIVGLIYNAVFAVMQYFEGVPQPVGAIGHQNLLGLMTNFVLVTSMTLLLVQRRFFWVALGIPAALLVDYLTASRATLGLAGLGIMLVLFFSCAKKMTGRKGALLGLFLIVCAVGGPLGWQSIQERRNVTEITGSNEQRDALKRAAWMIISDHPLGTGPNQYVMVANLGGYSQRAGVSWDAGTRATNVHDSYLLVFAETGLVGFIAMLVLLLMPALRGLRTAFRLRDDPRSDMLLGCTLSILVFAVHLMFEWAWVLGTSQYMFAIYSGLALGLVARMTEDALPGHAKPERSQRGFQEWPGDLVATRASADAS